MLFDEAFFREVQETTWGQIKGTTEVQQETTWGQIKGTQALHTPQHQPYPGSIAVKLLTKCSQVGTHRFPGHEPTMFPFAWQSNKAIHFYFTQNCLWDLSPRAQKLSIQHQIFEHFAAYLQKIIKGIEYYN